MTAADPRRRRVHPWAPPAVLLVLVLTVWIAIFELGFYPPYLFPGPVQVARSAAELATDGALWFAAGATVFRLGVGFFLSLVVGALLACWFYLSPLVRSAMNPYLLGLQSIPSLAWIPLAILWFGRSEDALLFVTIIGSVFAVTIGFADALFNVQPIFYRVARTMGEKRSGLLWRVGIPAATPYLVGVAKQGWSFAWRSLIGAEIVFASVGLGFLLNQGREFLNTAQVFASMGAILIIGILFERFIFQTVERRVRKRWGL